MTASSSDTPRPGDTSVAVMTPTDADNLVLMMDISDYTEELTRMADVVSNLRHALSEALTCTAIWCMCEAHELLRATEADEEPYR